MIRRSAEARAEASGSTYEAVLAEWAGVPIDQITADAPAAAEAESAAAPAPAAEDAPAPAAPAPAAAALDMGELLTAAAEKMGMPESMVERSAGARAKAQDTTVAAVLAEWAGIEAPAAEATPGPAADPSEPAPAADTDTAPDDESDGPDVEVLGEADEAPPKVATPTEPDHFEPEEDAVAAGALPRWLAALFVFVPAFAIAYALFLPNGPNCGDAGSLAVDPVTGVAVNCDLSEFGAEVADFFAIGLETYNGIGCVACHGAGGGGVANFPAFTGGELLSTFPEGQCDAQIEWIALGTAGWPDPTYGATNKPVGGSGAVMPGFEGTLTPEEIAAVTLYERVAFGGQSLDSALVDCGLSTGEEGGDAAMEGMEG
jgi:mono/diheme cytochrome c family protein